MGRDIFSESYDQHLADFNFQIVFLRSVPGLRMASSKRCEITLLIPAVAEVWGGYKQVKVRGRLKIHPSPWKEASLRCSGRCKARWDTPFTLDRSSSRLKCHCYARSPTNTNTTTTNLLSSWSVKSRLIWECFGGWISIDLVLRKIEGNILRKIENIFRCMHRTKSPLLPFSQAAIKALAGAAVSGSHQSLQGALCWTICALCSGTSQWHQSVAS